MHTASATEPRKLMRLCASSLPFWEQLSPRQQTVLLESAQSVRYGRGAQIHNSEMSCVGVLLLQSGALRAYLLSEEGREVTLYRLYAGDVCALSASCALQSVRFDIHIDAEEDVEGVLIPTGVFAALMQESVYVECFLYRMSTKRFSQVIDTMQQMLFLKFDRRLALFLCEESERTGQRTLRLTHEHAARCLGSAREVVTRALNQLADAGLVRLTRGGIELLDAERLRSWGVQAGA